MSFQEKNIIKTGHLPPPTGSAVQGSKWHYKAGADTAAVVGGASYFNAFRGKLQVGDIIEAEVNEGYRVYRVATVPETANVTTTALAFS